MKSGHLEAYIKIGDERIEEHAVTTEGEACMSCWIPSEEGKEFSIHCDNHLKSYSYRGEFTVDGHQRLERCAAPGTSLSSFGFPISASQVLPYQFARLRLSSDDTDLKNPCNIEKLGTIELRVWRVTYDIVDETWEPSGLTKSELGIVHERSKKAGSHCVSFSSKAIKKKREVQAANLRFIDPLEKPCCIFRFHYRSRDILQAQEIMPRPLSAPRSKRPHEREVNEATGSSKRARKAGDEVKSESDSDSDVEDEAALQAQVDALKAKMKKAKSKRGRRMKRETSPIVLMTLGETIDLTSD